MLCYELRARIQFCLGDYDQLMYFAVVLIYIQIASSLLGSLGALFNGVSLVNLVFALFALVAIESSSQSLGRTYAVLLGCGILLDIFWFILFSHQIWNISSDDYEPLFILSLRLTLCMQIVGFFVRMASSFLWIQMYRLGVSNVENTISRAADLQNSFLNPPTPALVRQNSHSDEILGGSIYDPYYYSSLFEGSQEIRHDCEGNPHGINDEGGSVPAAESSQLKSCISRSFQDINVRGTKASGDSEIIEL